MLKVRKENSMPWEKKIVHFHAKMNYIEITPSRKIMIKYMTDFLCLCRFEDHPNFPFSDEY